MNSPSGQADVHEGGKTAPLCSIFLLVTCVRFPAVRQAGLREVLGVALTGEICISCPALRAVEACVALISVIIRAPLVRGSGQFVLPSFFDTSELPVCLQWNWLNEVQVAHSVVA